MKILCLAVLATWRALLRAAAWWRPALRRQHITIWTFPHKEPGTRPHPTHTGSRALLRGRLRPWQRDCVQVSPPAALILRSPSRWTSSQRSCQTELPTLTARCGGGFELKSVRRKKKKTEHSVADRESEVRSKRRKTATSQGREEKSARRGSSQVQRGADWVWI